MHADYLVWNVAGIKFTVPDYYTNLAPIGFGRYGSVCSADNGLCDKRVAIKKIANPFAGEELAKRCYRELAILRRLNHPNVLCLSDAFLSPVSPIGNNNNNNDTDESEDLYICTQLVRGELRSLMMRRGCAGGLPVVKVKIIIYQLLHGLAYLHSRGIVHRDLKPENILVDDQSDVTCTGITNASITPDKQHDIRVIICDLGLARPSSAHNALMTGYISTRYYRAPEVMLTWRAYDGAALDVWSVGCVMAEALTGNVLFPGADHVHHLRLIIDLIGMPPDSVISRICSEPTKRYLKMLSNVENSGDDTDSGVSKRLRAKLANENIPSEAIDLISSLLAFDPNERPTAKQALKHAFFDGLAYLNTMEYPDDPITVVEEAESLEKWRQLIIEELEK